MNKKVLFAVAPLLLLGACTNEDAVNEVTTRNVVFSVNTLNKTYEPITRVTTSTSAELADRITSIGYAVFRNGVFFSSGTQSSSSANFGQLTVTIPSGSCKVYIAGYGSGSKNAYFSLNNKAWGISADEREVYYNYVDNVNIAENTSYTTELTRKTGAITLNIKDAANAPSNFAGIRLTYSVPTFWYMDLGSTTDSEERSVTFAGTTSSFPSVLIHTWPCTNKTLTLEVISSNNTVLKKKTITYDVYENKKTVITGELFGGDQPLTVTINDSWGEDNITPFE